MLFLKCCTSLSAIPNRSDVNIILLYEIIHFIGQDNQIAIMSYVCEIFVFSSQIRLCIQKVGTMDDFSNPTFGHLLTCKILVELVNGIEFIGSPSQPMEFIRHSAHK